MAVIRTKEKVNVSKHLCRYCRHKLQCLTSKPLFPPCSSLGRYNTIQGAIEEASSGETIYVEAGVYTEAITFSQDNVSVYAKDVTFNNCYVNMNESNVIRGNNTSFLNCEIDIAPIVNKRCLIDGTGNSGVINYNGNKGAVIGCSISANKEIKQVGKITFWGNILRCLTSKKKIGKN